MTTPARSLTSFLLLAALIAATALLLFPAAGAGPRNASEQRGDRTRRD